MARMQEMDASKKEIWHHFKPNELRIFGAFMYAYQNRLPYLKGEGANATEQPLPKYFQDPISHVVMPWSIWARFRMAYQTFAVEMARYPELNRQFAIVDVGANGELDSGTRVLEPKILAESKEVFDTIFGPGGLEWGDEEKLGQWADQFEDKLKEYGFKKLPKKNGKYEIAPMTVQTREFSGTGDLDEDPVSRPGDLDASTEPQEKPGTKPKKTGKSVDAN